MNEENENIITPTESHLEDVLNRKSQLDDKFQGLANRIKAFWSKTDRAIRVDPNNVLAELNKDLDRLGEVFKSFSDADDESNEDEESKGERIVANDVSPDTRQSVSDNSVFPEIIVPEIVIPDHAQGMAEDEAETRAHEQGESNSSVSDEEKLKAQIRIDADVFLKQISDIRSRVEKTLEDIPVNFNLDEENRIAVDKAANSLRLDFIQLDQLGAKLLSPKTDTPKAFEDVNSRFENVMAKIQYDATSIEKRLNLAVRSQLREQVSRQQGQAIREELYNQYSAQYYTPFKDEFRKRFVSQGMAEDEAETRAHEQAMRRINQIVEEKTNEKINEIVIREANQTTEGFAQSINREIRVDKEAGEKIENETLYARRENLNNSIKDFSSQYDINRLNTTEREEVRKEKEVSKDNSESESNDTKKRVEFIKDVIKGTAFIFGTLGKVGGELITMLGEGVKRVGDLINHASSVINNVVGGAVSVTNNILSSASSLVSQVPIVGNILSLPFDILNTGVGAVGNISQAVIGGTSNVFSGLLRGGGAAISGIGAGISSAASGIFNGIGTAVSTGNPTFAITGVVGGLFSGITNAVKGGATAVMGVAEGVLQGATNVIQNGVHAVLQIPNLIEQTTRKLIRSLAGLTAAILGLGRFLAKDVGNRISSNKSVTGYWSADPIMSTSENYHRTVESLRKTEEYYGKSSYYKTDTILAQAERFRDTMRQAMTGDGVNDKRLIDYSFLLKNIPELGKKYTLEQLVTSNDFSSLRFMIDAINAVEANWSKLYTGNNEHDILTQDALMSILGGDIMDSIMSYRSARITSNSRRLMLQVPLENGVGVLGRGRGTTAVTQSMREFEDSVAGLNGAIDEAKRNILLGLIPVFEPLIEKFTEFIDAIGARFNNLFNSLNNRTILDDIKEIFKDFNVKEFGSNIRQSLGYVSEFFKSFASSIAESFVIVFSAIESIFTDKPENLPGFNELTELEQIIAKQNPFSKARRKLLFKALKNAFSESNQNFIDNLSESTSNVKTGLHDTWDESIDVFENISKRAGNFIRYGVTEYDKDDYEDYKQARNDKKDGFKDANSAQKSANALRDTVYRKGGTEWFNTMGAFVYANYGDYTHGVPFSYERIIQEGLKKALGRELNDEELKMFGEGQPSNRSLDTNKEYLANPEKYFEHIDTVVRDTWGVNTLYKLVGQMMNISNSTLVDRTEGKVTGITLEPGRTSKGEYTVKILVNGDHKVVNKLNRNGVVNEGTGIKKSELNQNGGR